MTRAIWRSWKLNVKRRPLLGFKLTDNADTAMVDGGFRLKAGMKTGTSASRMVSEEQKLYFSSAFIVA